tara:strand:+ start:269 stop:610 length:342 start_codon:yes stop_codon:yes gene_type:complete
MSTEFILYDHDKNYKKKKIVVIESCSATFDYGNKKQQILLEKNDYIILKTNVIINMKNNSGIYINSYKSRVSEDILKIYCEDSNYLKIEDYKELEDIICFSNNFQEYSNTYKC